MRNTFSLLLIAFLVIGTSSCEKKIINPGNDFLGQEYFPTEIGHFVTYQVDSTIYDNFSGTVFTTTSQIREIVDSEFIDNEGRPAVRIARQFRPSNAFSWETARTQMTYAVRTDRSVEKVVDNLRFVPLIFPVQDDRTWNGNVFIDTEQNELSVYDDWQYRYFNEDIAQSFSGQTFEKTVSILQNEYDNAQEKIYSAEIYAEGVGMIYREQSFLELISSTLPPLETNPWPERANSGTTVIWKVIDHN